MRGGGGSIKVGMWRMEALGEKPDVSLKMEAPLGCVGMTRMRHVHPTKEVHHTPGSTRRLLFVIVVAVVLVFEAGPHVAQAVLKLTIKLRMTLEFHSYCLYLSSAEIRSTDHYGDLFIILCMHVCLQTLYLGTHAHREARGEHSISCCLSLHLTSWRLDPCLLFLNVNFPQPRINWHGNLL